MLYSKNGSIPKPQTDGTSGWITVPYPPEVSADKEVIWWYPPGWVVRDPKPEQSMQTFTEKDEAGNDVQVQKLADWSWSQTEQKWVAYPAPVVEDTVVVTEGSATATIDLSLATATTTIGV